MNDKAHRYESLAARLRQRIASGALEVGSRVPSVRVLSRQSGLSIGTVVQAYRKLEQEGAITARPQSGYYVSGQPLPAVRCRRSTTIAAPRDPCRALLQRALALGARDDLLPLHAASPAPSLLPLTRISAVARDLLRRHPERMCAYAHPPGVLELRRRIARRLALAGLDVVADDVVVTAGAMEAIALSLQVATRPGDSVLVESPTYHGLMQALQVRGLKAVEVGIGARGLDLERAIEVVASGAVRAALLIPSFSNPSGACMSETARRELARACARHAVTVIEDDIYGELSFDGTRLAPLKAHDTASGMAILCGSVSKILSPGLRVGWAVSARWRDMLIRAKAAASCATPTLSQYIVSELLVGSTLDRHLRRLRAAAAVNLTRFQREIAEHFPAGTRASHPAGGLVLWAQLPQGYDAQQLFEIACERGIGILPGSLFSARGAFRDCFRLGYALEWNARVRRALQELGRIAASARVAAAE